MRTMGRTGNDPPSPSTLASRRSRYRGGRHRRRGFRSHESKAGGSPTGRVRSTAGCSATNGCPSAARIPAARAGAPAAGAGPTAAAVRSAAGRSTGPAKELTPARNSTPEPAPCTGGRFLYAVIERGRSSSSQGDAVGDGLGLGLEPALGAWTRQWRDNRPRLLEGAGVVPAHRERVVPTVVSAGIAAVTLKPPYWWHGRYATSGQAPPQRAGSDRSPSRLAARFTHGARS